MGIGLRRRINVEVLGGSSFFGLTGSKIGKSQRQALVLNCLSRVRADPESYHLRIAHFQLTELSLADGSARGQAKHKERYAK